MEIKINEKLIKSKNFPKRLTMYKVRSKLTGFYYMALIGLDESYLIASNGYIDYIDSTEKAYEYLIEKYEFIKEVKLTF
jgi:hypothetical protein